MQLAPRLDPPAWVFDDVTQDDGALDLTPYPTLDEEMRVAAQCGERILSRAVLIAALALLCWMAIGVALAWQAGRLG